MIRQTVTTWIVIALTCSAVIPFAIAFALLDMPHVDDWIVLVLMGVVCTGILGGVVGGVALAISRKNPLWLIATVVALSAGYAWLLFVVAAAMGGGMH